MPFDDNSFNPEDEEKKAQQAGQNTSSSTVPPGGIIPAGNPGGASTPTNSSTPTSSGSFTNLQQYLDANKGNDLAGRLAGNVQNQIDEAGKAQSSATQQFNSDVAGATTQNDQKGIQQAIVDAGKGDVSGDDTTLFQRQLHANDNWNPNLNSIQTDSNANYGQAYSATQNAQQAADATKSEGGRFALLDRYFQNPNYSSGQKNLDQFLVQSDPNAPQAFGSVQSGAQKLGQDWNTSLAAAQGLAAQAQETNKSSADAANEALYGQAGSAANLQGGAVGNLMTGLQNTVTADQAAAANNPALQAALQSGDLRKIVDAGGDYDQILKSFGIIGDGGLVNGQNYRTYGINASDYYHPTTASSFNTSNVATADQLAQLNALAKLGGVDQTWLSDPSQVGTYAGANSAGTFDKNGFVSAVNNNRDAYTQTLNNQNEFSKLTDNQGNPYYGGNPQIAGFNPNSNGGGSIQGQLNYYKQQLDAQKAASGKTNATTQANYDALEKYLNSLPGADTTYLGFSPAKIL